MPQRKGAKGTQQVKRKPKIIHAQIKSPVLLRKTILEASILSLENLKILKNIRQIKRRKDKLKMHLRKECKEMKDMTDKFCEVIPHPSEIGIHVEKESERETKVETKVEEKKRNKQEKLMVKTTKKDESPFEQKDEFDFDIDKLKEKIKGL